MAAFAKLGPGPRLSLVVLGLALAIGAAVLAWTLTRPPAPAATSASATPAAAPLADAAPAPSAPEITASKPPASDPAAAAPEATAVILPVIETWRVAADGAAVVSGSAVPGAIVDVVVDGTTVASGEVTGAGEFAILFTLAPNPRPSLMWLSMTSPGQDARPSEDMVALGPVDGPPPAVMTEDPALASETLATAEEPAPPPALLLSGEGAVVLQPADPAALPDTTPATLMIDTIAYSPDGEVLVGGRGAAGAVVRLYLDNVEKVTVTVADSGVWTTGLPDTAPGIYTLRADQLDAGGKVTSRFETPFKRETPEDLAAVAQAGPEPTPAPAAEPAAPTTGTATAETSATPTPVAAETPAEPSADIAADTTVAAPAPPQAPDPQPVVAAAIPQTVTVTVQPGFTLWGIAQERYGDGVMYVQVFDANREKIKDPDLIYPGQVFSVPATAP